eukprot:Nk52_evm34s1073 gene=Nk52_evmTU34s1073
MVGFVSDEILLERNAADEQTQDARMRALAKKTLLVVMCPLSGYKYWAFEEISQNLGVTMYLVGSSDNKYCKKLLDQKLAAGIIEADVESDGATAIENAIKAIEASEVEFDGVMSVIEHAIPIAAGIADHFGLPGFSGWSVATARNKFEAREALREANVKTCRYTYIHDMEGIEKAAATVGFPAIVKPASGAKSEGVYKVANNEELEKACKTIFDEVKDNAMTAFNPGVDNCHYALMEQFITGDEYDVDVLLNNGEVVFACVNDNWETLPPYFLETGSNVPSLLSSDKQQQMIDYAIECAKAMKFCSGCLHIETKWDLVEGPMLIEINARLGGGPAREFCNLVWGVDLFNNWVMTSAGIPINPPTAEKPKVFSAHYLINAPYTGVLDSVKFITDIASIPNVAYAKPMVSVGDKVVGPDTGIPSWVGEFRYDSHISEQDAVDNINKILEGLQYPITPSAPKNAAVTDSISSQVCQTVG